MKTIFLTTLLLAFSIMTSAQIKPKVATSEISTANTSILDADSDADGIGNVAMNKGELIDAIAKDAGLSNEPESKNIIDTDLTAKADLKKLADELVNITAKEAGLSKEDAKKALEALTGTMTRSLKKGDKVALIEFGTFYVGQEPAPNIKDPISGKIKKMSPVKVVKFKPCPALADAVKNSPGPEMVEVRKGRLSLETNRVSDRDIDIDEDGLGDSAMKIERCDGMDNDCDGATDDTLKNGMNKAELIDAMAKEAGLSKADAGKALSACVSILTQSLKKGDSIQLIGFGTFSISNKPAHRCKDPKTDKIIKVAAKKVAKFKAGKALADTVK
ncbi:MAG: HU family DNA-binding protein [Flavobacteriaceae bacterium]|nr:HU family DNA-binding protein [Flavobacteriaceae bacterium]